MNVVTHLEVCIDNIESLHYAIAGGATRIELCSSLALGGLTPSYGFMQQAAKLSSVPVYAMIRPRQGDFFYCEEEIEMMRWDIEAAHQSGLDGVVLGVLTQEGDIHMPYAATLCEFAQALGLGVTFHRAFDQCRDAEKALEEVISLGCERILTSGLAPSAPQGIDVLRALVKQAQGRIAIMAGAGVNAKRYRGRPVRHRKAARISALPGSFIAGLATKVRRVRVLPRFDNPATDRAGTGEVIM